VRLVAVSDPANPAQQQEGLERLLALDGQRDQAFAEAPFTVFGLDSSWTGLRSFGGWGTSDGITNHLSLAFGDPSDEDAPIVRIETRAPRVIGPGRAPDPLVDRYLAASDLVGYVARATGALAPDVRAAAFPYQDPDAYGKDPTAPWDDATIAVEGLPVAAKVLHADDTTWVALLPVDDLFVGITATGWPFATTGLVAVTDFAAYTEGSAEIRERMRRRHTPPTTP
jgi:hypothetical protein